MKKQQYKLKVTFLSNAELLNEYEGVCDLCNYVSADSFEYVKLRVIKDEFHSRGLSALIG